MPTYTVHAPPPREGKAASDPQRFVFVRDGFHAWAFILTPLWLLWHRLWLAFVGYAAATTLINLSFRFINAPRAMNVLAMLLIAGLVGLESASLRRWTLGRRGWRTLGFVVGDDQESAERRFFGEWTKRAAAPPAPEPKYTTPVRRGPPSASDVIGLFPEPGGGG